MDNVLPRDNKGRFLKGISYSPKTQLKKGQHWRKRKPFWDYNWLYTEYVTERRTAAEIGQQFKVSDQAIIFWLKKLNIPRRTVSQTRNVKYWGLKGPDNPMYGKRGILNPNYKGSGTPERQASYAKYENIEFIKSIYKRDNYKCRRCGSPSKGKKTLHAHHIKSWSEFPELRFELDNVITLCNKCHNWVHSNANTNGEYIIRRC